MIADFLWTKLHEIYLEKMRIYGIDASFATFTSNSIIKFGFFENSAWKEIIKIIWKLFLYFMLEKISCFEGQELSNFIEYLYSWAFDRIFMTKSELSWSN